MAKGMSKKERKLRGEIAELKQKKRAASCRRAGGIIIFVLFLMRPPGLGSERHVRPRDGCGERSH